MSAVGIDLGTTICSVARADDHGRISLARLRDGTTRLASVVAVDPSGRSVVGDEAQRIAPLDPDSSFAFFKRSMGTTWSVRTDGRTWTAPQLSAVLLAALADDAAGDFGERPRRAAITIPAYFGDDARRATRESGELAGLEVIALPHEPTAACVAHRPDPHRCTTVLVYDLGGGTFDVSVVRFGPDGAEVLATAGDDRLGGKDWDDVLITLISDRLLDAVGADVRDDLSVLAELQERAREAKHALTRLPKTAVTLRAGGALHRVQVTREEFGRMTDVLFGQTEELVERVLDDIGGRDRLDQVLLVGGSSRMPQCREVLVRTTGLEPRGGVDPDAAVATGAALLARESDAARGRRGGPLSARLRVRDATAHALGFVVVAADGSRYVNEVMIARNAPIPAEATKQHRLAVGIGDSGALDVFMLQGEAERPLDTNPLGRWSFHDVPGHHRGHVEVDVSYAYDEHGVVHVSATVGGRALAAPAIDRADRDLRWTAEDPTTHRVPDLAVALVIDVSGSMRGRRLAEARRACCEFVDVLKEAGAGDRLALVAFGSSARVVAPLGVGASAMRRAAQALDTAGSTNMADGLDVAWRALEGATGRRVLVVLTDGAPDDVNRTLDGRKAVVRGGGEIIARGVAGANKHFLRKLDSGGELLGPGQLVASFRGIAQQLASRRGGMGRGQ